MNLEKDMVPYVEAGFSANWVLSKEAEESERDLVRMCSQQKWDVAVWDAERGTRLPLQGKELPRKGVDPTEPLKVFRGEGDRRRVVVLHNYHRFLENPLVVQSLFNAAVAGKAEAVSYVVVSPVLNLPPELEKLFRVIEHRLPDDGQLRELANSLMERDAGEPVDERVIAAARGLTRREAEDAFALSLLDHDGLVPEVVWGLKAQSVAKSGHLEVYRGKEGFASLGGLEGLKSFTRKLLRPENKLTPHGVLLLGPAGVGKSCFAKALGNEVGRPTLLLDVGRLYHKHVGASEENVRAALGVAEAMSPCVLFIDEVEKALSGVGGEGDSGVATRVFGNILTFMSDRRSDIFFCLTSNDVSKLPPEFSRAERLDGIFFVDLPGEEEKERIWRMYLKLYGLEDRELPVVDDENWTGAEIRSCCRLAASLGVPLTDAARHVVPVAVSAGDKVEALRTWAENRCLSAATGGVYRRQGLPGEGRRRVGERKG